MGALQYDVLADVYPLAIVFVCVLFFIVYWDALGGILLLNVITNVVLNMAIKNVFKKKRPSLCSINGFNFKPNMANALHGYGMPSGHTQIAFAFTVLLLFICMDHYLKDLKAKDISDKWKIVRPILFFVISVPVLLIIPFAVAFQRVKHQCHNVVQVYVGGCLGCVVAIGYGLMYKHVQACNRKKQSKDNVNRTAARNKKVQTKK